MRTAFLPASIALALSLAAGSSGAQPTSRTSRPAIPDYSWVPIIDAADVAVPEPPSGRWLLDDAGLEYTLFRWEKHPGYYHFDPGEERIVTLRNGVRFTVEHHDDQYLYLRWYRGGSAVERSDTTPGARDVASEPSYRTDLPIEDHLHLERWDEGLPRAGQWRNGFAIADMNGDGHLDIAHGPPRKGADTSPVVLLGDGAGHWRRWDEARFPALPYDYGSIAAGDLDGDGAMDLVVAAHLSGIFALYGDGAGRFVSRSEGLPHRRTGADVAANSASRIATQGPVSSGSPPAPPAFTSRAITLADWNGDGSLDILALSEGPASVRDLDTSKPPLGKVIFLAREDGGWQALHGPGALMGDTIVAADLDRDGRLDFVTASRVVGSTELLNYGEPQGAWSVASLPLPSRGLRVSAVAVDHFDDDGRLDVAVAFKSRTGTTTRWGLDVFFGTATPRSWRRASIWGGTVRGDGDGVTALAAGDVDGDGDADLVALGADGTTRLLLNDGYGAFALERSPETDPAPEHRYCAGYSAAIADLDGDGRGEIVAAFAGEPGSEVMFLGTMPVRCRAQGALLVFKVSRRTSPGGISTDSKPPSEP